MSTFRASTQEGPLPYAEEWRRTCPDYVVYHPAPDGNPRWDDEDFTVLNEQTIIVATKNGDLLATWTGHGPFKSWILRLFSSRSNDGGKSWTQPMLIAGSKGDRAGWQVPVIIPSGRIYLFYCKYVPAPSTRMAHLACRVSDDDGRSWGSEVLLPMKRRSIDHPDPNIPVAWLGWRQVEWDAQGRALFPFTRFDSKLASEERPKEWCQSEVIRFENIAEGPDPSDLQITWLPEGKGEALTVPSNMPGLKWANESNPIPLPDGRIFISLRTRLGQVWYSVSDDDGATFRQPEVMRDQDGGAPILNPSDNAPLYRLSDGRYLLFYHDNDGNAFNTIDVHDTRNRRPCYVSVGAFRPEAHQPIWWSKPKLFIDIDDVPIDVGFSVPRYEAIDYCGFTEINGEAVLWYPDRKHFILGKRISEAFLSDMHPSEP